MNILHLSDIHFGRNYARYSIKDCFDLKSEILDELIKCVSNLKELAPEHIIVTGDIAWHGKKDEYDEALLWFRKLLQATNLTGKDITFVLAITMLIAIIVRPLYSMKVTLRRSTLFTIIRIFTKWKHLF